MTRVMRKVIEYRGKERSRLDDLPEKENAVGFRAVVEEGGEVGGVVGGGRTVHRRHTQLMQPLQSTTIIHNSRTVILNVTC